MGGDLGLHQQKDLPLVFSLCAKSNVSRDLDHHLVSSIGILLGVFCKLNRGTEKTFSTEHPRPINGKYLFTWNTFLPKILLTPNLDGLSATRFPHGGASWCMAHFLNVGVEGTFDDSQTRLISPVFPEAGGGLSRMTLKERGENCKGSVVKCVGSGRNRRFAGQRVAEFSRPVRPPAGAVGAQWYARPSEHP